MADVIAFVLALVVVTFLHLVVGEMAPKSWAIAHPETSATLLALPMRAFMLATRPALLLMNEMANAMLRRIGVEPVNEKQDSSNSDDLRQLVEHSASVGALDASYRARITGCARPGAADPRRGAPAAPRHHVRPRGRVGAACA
ncbi:MAG: DUF21 domain-containing protein [Quadrisphaera sp.]